MKKLVFLLACLALILSLSISVFAAGGTTLSSKANAEAVKPGGTVSVMVSVENCEAFKSMGLTLEYDHDVFELESGEWRFAGYLISNFNKENDQAVILYGTPVEKNGNAFKFTLKVKESAAVGDTTVTVKAIMKSGSTVVAEPETSTTIKVECATHTYGPWVTGGPKSHEQVCSVCGYVQAASHKWNDGTVTTPATCKDTGVMSYTCVTCGETKTETIAKTTAHTFGDWAQTKAPSCTEAGEEARTCTTCGAVEKRTVEALGHDYGAWTQTKAPSCTEAGVETQTCSRCGDAKTRAIEAAGHQYGDFVVTKEATETEEGVKTATCSVCGDKKTESIPKKTASDPQPVDPGKDQPSSNSNTWIIIVIVVAVVVIAAVVVVLLIRRKRNRF